MICYYVSKYINNIVIIIVYNNISGVQIANLNESWGSKFSLFSKLLHGQPDFPYYSTPSPSISPSVSPQSLRVSSVSPQSLRVPSVSPQSSHVSHSEIYNEPNTPEVEFSLLLSNITDIIQRNLNSSHLASMKRALAYVTVHPMSPKPLFSDAEVARIKQSKDVIGLMEECRSHLSWNKYSLLKLIVKKSGSKEARHELQRFQRTVNVRQRLKDLGNDWLQDGKSYPEGFETMMVIVDEDYDDISVDQLEEVEKFISTMTLLPTHAMKATEVSKDNSVLIHSI